MHGDKEWCCEDSLPTKDLIVLTCFISLSILLIFDCFYLWVQIYKFFFSYLKCKTVVKNVSRIIPQKLFKFW